MKRLLLFWAVILLFSACTKETTTTDELPTPTQDITGFVFLYNQYQQSLPNNVGVTVSLDGTSYSAVTDSAGMYVIKNVPAGTYEFVYTKSGYGTCEVNHYFTLGGNVSLNSVNLYQNSTANISNLAAQVSGTNVAVTGNTNLGYPQQQAVNIAVFFGLTPEVSPSNYTVFFTGSATDSSFTVYLTNANYSYFTAGQTVYMVAYGITNSATYINPVTGKNTPTSLGATPSAVISAVIQ